MMNDLKSALLKHDRMVPRYTSYPTAPHFKVDGNQDWYKERLKKIPSGESISLYVHIPFCPKLCWFCGCNTRITNHYEAVRDYTDGLLKEMGLAFRLLKSKRLEVSHLHFGGGSPTILESGDFSRIITTLKESVIFKEDAEIAIEIDPRNADLTKIKTYKEHGVNRVSIGIQDFNQEVMRAINRPQTFELVESVLRDFRRVGINRINMDLMYGLPYQNADTMKECIRLAVLLNPDRIALFGYAHVPWLKKHMRLIPESALPSTSERFDLFETAARLLEDEGYISIGIDHFARDEDGLSKALSSNTLHRNFQGYTTDQSRYMVSFGASAISFLDGAYIQNVPHLPKYRELVNSERFPIEKTLLLEKDDELIADIVKDMMCNLSVNPLTKAHARGLGDYDFSPAFKQLRDLERDGLVLIEEDGTVHAVLRQAARLASACFDTYLNTTGIQRHVTSA
jgi:oxygen-independent coproporphyrinogen-3 oxidase